MAKEAETGPGGLRLSAGQVSENLDLSGWLTLAKIVEPALTMAAEDGAEETIFSVRVTVGDEAISQIDTYKLANDAARERGAEMVGMHRVDGKLVPNPDAKWQITEGTRESLKSLTQRSINEGWSADKFERQIIDSHAFSPERASMIARTEMRFSRTAGQLEMGRAVGANKKQWSTAQDDEVSDECVMNGSSGPDGDGIIDIDDAYPSGAMAPPEHPNCRCVLSVLIRD